MTFRDTLDLALRNLGQAKLRTALTTLGVSIGIASLAGMVSLGVGLQDQFVGRFQKSGMFDAITVMSASDRPGGLATLGGGARGGRGGGFGRRGAGAGRSGPASADGTARELTDETLQELAALPNVREVYPSLRVPLEVKYGTESEFVAAAGVPMGARTEGGFQTLTHGRFFESADENACLNSLAYVRFMYSTSGSSVLTACCAIS